MRFRCLRVALPLLAVLVSCSFGAGRMAHELVTTDVEVTILASWQWETSPAGSWSLTMDLPLLTDVETPSRTEGRELQSAMLEATTDIEKQHRIGRLLLEGWGAVRASPADALDWLRRAADRGHAGAQNDLAALYLVGRGTPQSFTRAFNWFTRSAAQGRPEGQFGAGICYLFSRGCVASDVRARQNFEKSAKQHLYTAELVLSAQNLVAGILEYDEAVAYERLSLAMVHGGSDAHSRELDDYRSALLPRLTENEVRLSQSSSRVKFQKQRNEQVTVIGPTE